MNLSHYFYWNNVFSPKEIKDINSLIYKHKDKKEEKHLAASGVNKTSTVYPIELKYLKEILNKALLKIIENNQNHYGYDIFNFTDNLCLNFNIYEKNQEYDWHSDAEHFKSSDIKLTVLINISDANFSGGELNLLNSKNAIVVPELNNPGSMVVFSSFILHKVNPIKKGTRKTLTIFVTGPAFK